MEVILGGMFLAIIAATIYMVSEMFPPQSRRSRKMARAKRQQEPLVEWVPMHAGGQFGISEITLPGQDSVRLRATKDGFALVKGEKAVMRAVIAEGNVSLFGTLTQQIDVDLEGE